MEKSVVLCTECGYNIRNDYCYLSGACLMDGCLKGVPKEKKGEVAVEITRKEMLAILRLIEGKTIFKSPEEFNTLYELWQRIESQIKKECEEDENA